MNSPSDPQSISFGFKESPPQKDPHSIYGVFPGGSIDPSLITNLALSASTNDVNARIRQLDASIQELGQAVSQLMQITAPYRRVDEVNSSVGTSIPEAGTSQLSHYLLTRIQEIRGILEDVRSMNRTMENLKIDTLQGVRTNGQ